MWSLFRRGIPEHVVDNIVGEGTNVRGDLKGPGGFRIDGTVRGSIVAEGAVVVGDKGAVEGTITAREVVVLGRVHGDVTATGHLEIGPMGRVMGDVAVTSVKVHAGGAFHGASKIGDAGGEARLATSTSPFGLLPSNVPHPPPTPITGTPIAETPISETKVIKEGKDSKGRTLPPPIGAVPPPAPTVTKSHERIAVEAVEAAAAARRAAAND